MITFHFIQDLILPFNNLNNLKERTNLIFHQFKKFFILLKKYTFFSTKNLPQLNQIN